MGYKDEDEIASRYIEMHYIELPKYFKKNPKTKTKIETAKKMLKNNMEIKFIEKYTGLTEDEINK